MEHYVKTFEQFINESKVNENENIKVLSKEYGEYDDKMFFYSAYRKTPEELENLLDTSKKDLSWLKKHSKGLFGAFNRKDAQWVQVRINWIKDIIAAKKKNGPDYISDNYK